MLTYQRTALWPKGELHCSKKCKISPQSNLIRIKLCDMGKEISSDNDANC